MAVSNFRDIEIDTTPLIAQPDRHLHHMSRYNRRPSYTVSRAVEDMKVRLNRAFAALRRQGLIARQNYLCCSSCAGYSITEDAVKRVGKGKKVNGCVFYHRQDTERFLEGNTLFLAYGELDSTELGTIGLPTAQVGALVMAALEAEGLEPHWDGDPNARIELDPEEHVVKMSLERDRARSAAA
jgi:hypothetical protein